MMRIHEPTIETVCHELDQNQRVFAQCSLDGSISFYDIDRAKSWVYSDSVVHYPDKCVIVAGKNQLLTWDRVKSEWLLEGTNISCNAISICGDYVCGVRTKNHIYKTSVYHVESGSRLCALRLSTSSLVEDCQAHAYQDSIVWFVKSFVHIHVYRFYSPSSMISRLDALSAFLYRDIVTIIASYSYYEQLTVIPTRGEACAVWSKGTLLTSDEYKIIEYDIDSNTQHKHPEWPMEGVDEIFGRDVKNRLLLRKRS